MSYSVTFPKPSVWNTDDTIQLMSGNTVSITDPMHVITDNVSSKIEFVYMDNNFQLEKYDKVTDVEQLTDGYYLIVCEPFNVLFKSDVDSDQARNSLNIEDHTIRYPDCEFYIQRTNEEYKIINKSGKTIGTNANANSLKYGDNYTNDITINTTATIKALNISTADKYLRFNCQNLQRRFRYYNSDSRYSCLIQLYKLKEE